MRALFCAAVALLAPVPDTAASASSAGGAAVCKTCALLSSPTTSLRTYKPAGLPKDDLHRQTKEVNELTTAVTDDLTKLADKKKTEIEAV